MAFKEKDFVKVDFDLFANGTLVQTTSEKKGKEAGLEAKEFKPATLILGRGFVLKALDEDIMKSKDKKGTIELTPDQAYGKRKKDFIKTLPKSAFDEHKLRPVVGITYDFNGMYGTVKSVVGGRIMVDFNNPLAGKDIKIEYSVVDEIKDVAEKIKVILGQVMQIPEQYFKVEEKEKEVKVGIPEQLMPLEAQLKKAFEEDIPDIKEYKVTIESFKNK